jgi:dihydrofolate reductase
VLTHHARAPIEMNGGTTFFFVTDGIHAALDRAREAAKGKDIRIGGGVSAVRQYLAAGLIDRAHFAIAPDVLGTGEHVFVGLNLKALGYDAVEHVSSDAALHIVLEKR